MRHASCRRVSGRGRRELVLLMALLVPWPVAAVNGSLTPSDTQRALTVAGGTEAARGKFHAPYVLEVTHRLVRGLEVLTEFRRTVTAAENARTRGDWAVAHGARSLGGRGVEDTVKPWRKKVTIIATLQFDPMHTYVTVPNCEVMMGGMPVLASLDRRTIPLSSLPYSSRGVVTTSLVGATIEADFDADAVGQTTRSAVVMCEGRDVVRVEIDFSRLE